MKYAMYPKLKHLKRKILEVRVYPDGREVCCDKTSRGRAEYWKRITSMWTRQKHLCFLCWQPLKLADATFEHEAGRGMGGGHRDDRISLPDGTLINGAAHSICNYLKGSQRVTYNR